jgi:periplasmic protein TonB
LKTSNNIPSLDDLVFEGRNREYGSYVLRKSYNRRVAYSFFYTIGIVIVLFIYPFMDLIYPRILNPHSTSFHSAEADLTNTYFRKSQDEKPMGAAAASTLKAPEVVEEKSVAVSQTDINKTESSTSDSTGTSSDGSAKSGTGISDNTSTDGNDKILGSADVNPQFPGGPKAMQAFIRENMHYSDEVLSLNIRGTILVYVVIMKDGSMRDIKVIRGLHPDLDEEALRVVKSMPPWNPAMQDGVAVNVRCTLPIIVSSRTPK